MKKNNVKKLYLLIGLFLLLVPLGLLTTSPAWGEWEADYYRTLLGFIPERLRHFASWYQAPISGYQLEGHGAVLGYYLSAVIGIVLIFGIFFAWSRFDGRGRK
ncbi:MAG: hypothetical protein GXP58_05590 [Deltaproteobacteria bacterium]|nr:hypothetical protein [Deltaproteobacteria bacterium]